MPWSQKRDRRRERSAHAPAAPLAPITAVNQVWTTDFKGEFRTGDGVYFTPHGARKLAHYVEREITRLLASRSGPIALPSDQASTAIRQRFIGSIFADPLADCTCRCAEASMLSLRRDARENDSMGVPLGTVCAAELPAVLRCAR